MELGGIQPLASRHAGTTPMAAPDTLASFDIKNGSGTHVASLQRHYHAATIKPVLACF
jgi:hypothetical protein